MTKIYVLLSVLVILAQSAYGFQLPSSYSTELAKYSNIITTSTCTDGGPENCNTTCPTRTSFPAFEKPIESISSKCTVYNGSPPIHSDIGNGWIEFNSSTTDCPLHEKVYQEYNQHFTITMWVKVSTNTNVLSIGSGLTLKYDGNRFVLQNTFRNTMSSEWYFITLRFNDKLSWFVNGLLVKDGLSFTASSSYSVKLGPGQDLTSGSLIIVDVRWYSDVITDREIDYLYKRVKDDFCRCPPTHPKVVKDTLPIEYMKCSDGSSEVLRLGENAHIPGYMADASTTTKWVSGIVNEVNITLTLKNQFQMKRLSLVGIAKSPASLNVILHLNNAEVQAIRLTVNGGNVSYDFEKGSITSRTQYQKIIADKVIVQAKFSTSDYLTVSELTLEARCSCYGNDNACNIVKDGYTCSCLSSSNTNGPHCDVCGTGFYRSSEQFVCKNPCACNMTGSSVDTQCEEVEGQCKCHSNITGRQCSICEHNTANFSDSGCTACECNPDGITKCSDDLTCNCKQNVDTMSGKCDKCLPNYYNISSPAGCAACECDLSGTRVAEPYCESGKGECYCRANVEGKTCKTCKDEYYGLSGNKIDGCDACECNIVGSASFICDKDTGQCPCFGESIPTEINNRQCIPTALKLEPLFGPKAGATLLTLTGTLLGEKATVKLTIGGEEQTVVDRNLTVIVFKTKESTEIEYKPIRLVWSYGSHTYSDGNFDSTTQIFEYKINPQMIVPTLNLRTFASGGCIIQVGGDNYDSVPYPKLRVYLDGGKEIQSPCVATKKTLKCSTPTIGINDVDRNVSYGFWLDGFMANQNVTESQGSVLEVVKDPSIYTGMSETFRNTFDDLFKVKGERLNDACHDSDVSITLGDKNCAILSRHDDVITCDPGESFPGTARSVTVNLKIGNIEVEWGTLKINSFWTNTEFIYIAVGAGVFLIIIIAFIVCVNRCRRKSISDSPDDSIPLEIGATGKTEPSNYTTLNPIAMIQPQYTEIHTKTSKEIADDFCKRLLQHVGKVVNSSIIERSNIDPGKICTHKGKKIRVISGQYNASTSSPYSGSSLTIKTLIDRYPEEGDLPEWLNTGLLECTMLQDFDNDNVLKIMGIAIDTKNIYIIYPAMANKTLKDYLISEPLNVEKKLEICTCVRVCEGMNYLSSQSIVHRDLAARNCWVTRDFEVKISDASFSYDLYPDEYLHSNGRYQPVRWMAPESLRQGFYDAKSDVWSYGVDIWEVFANGYMPYYDITENAMIKSKVCDEHYRLDKPVNCDDAVFQIICDCQKDKSKDRPNFFIIQSMFDNILNPGASLVQKAYQQELAGHETGRETYENLRIVPPSRPSKGHRPLK